MLIKSILSEDRTLAKNSDASKKRVLETLATLFAEHMGLEDSGDLFQQFISRERLGSTGIGEGIAIPHCKYKTNGRTLCACITLKNSVDFDSIDNKAVDVIFAMLVPEDAETSHLETLANLAQALQKPDYVNNLRSANNSSELYAAAVS